MLSQAAAWEAQPFIALRSQGGAGRMAVPPATESLWAPELAGRASMFLSDSLPVDASLLESAIRDFFDRLGELGLSLSESQIDLLYCSALLTVATAVALEIVRRKATRPAMPALRPEGGERFVD